MTHSSIMPTYYTQLPIAFEYGKGAWLYDTEGNAYLDAFCGIAVTSLGHAHPAVTAAICEQAGKLIHTSNTYQITKQQQLADKLVQLSGMDQAFFCNSGAEANETAIKMSRVYAKKKNIANPVIIATDTSFHGRTMATMSASSARIREGFEPLVASFIHVPFNDLDVLNKLAQEREDVVGIMLEPIQGESGVRTADANYLPAIRKLCNEKDWLFMLDEVQTGIGRTGKLFNYQYHQNLLPDVLTAAKALANGVPIGVCLARGKANNLFGPGKHGSTFGGNPLACNTALAVLNTMEKDQLLKNAAEMGEYILQRLRATLGKKKEVVEIRGQGMMIGVELDRPCRDILNVALKHRVLFIVSANTVMRILPPIILSKDEADQLVERLNKTVEEFLQQ
jgi:acetylornithine/N-succinyldiaminopimelate aminotransferase